MPQVRNDFSKEKLIKPGNSGPEEQATVQLKKKFKSKNNTNEKQKNDFFHVRIIADNGSKLYSK